MKLGKSCLLFLFYQYQPYHICCCQKIPLLKTFAYVCVHFTSFLQQHSRTNFPVESSWSNFEHFCEWGIVREAISCCYSETFIIRQKLISMIAFVPGSDDGTFCNLLLTILTSSIFSKLRTYKLTLTMVGPSVELMPSGLILVS